MSEGFGKYDYSQVVTIDDLRNISRELDYIYRHTPWYKFIERWGIGVSIGVTIGLLNWILEGKGGIKNSSGEIQ